MVLPFNIFAIIFFGIILVADAGVIDFKKLINASDPDADEFAKLMDKFKFRVSNSSDATRRFGNFRKAKKNIEELRAKFKNAKFAVNKFSLMSKEEQQKFFGAMPIQRPSADEIARGKRSALDGLVSAAAPTSFDFRTYGKVSPIKNQAQCGSCWAFTSTALVESQYLLRYNQSLDLSEQNLLSCATANNKCNGGDILQAFNYIKANGMQEESCSPYTATDGTCSTSTCASNPQKYYIGGYRNFGSDETTYPAQLYNYGPASMAFYVPQAFMSYSSGILDFPASACMNASIGMHGMVIVGYTDDYWIAKNSWGTDWGEQGYVRFRRGQNFCGMTLQVAAPYLNVTGTTTTVKVASTTTTTPPPSTPTPAPMSDCFAGNGVTTMTNALRNYVLDVFNGKRSEIAKGIFQMKNGINAPAAQNMKKLVYNCTLEMAALNYINTCNGAYLLGNTYTTSLAFGSVVPINTTISMAPQYLVSFTAAQQDTGMVVTDGSSAFSYDEETQIGCAYTTTPCSSMPYPSILVCTITPLPPSNTTPAYTVGNGCTSNSQCTKPGYNKCDTNLKLCYA
jgi:C1A family cysteine protease